MCILVTHQLKTKGGSYREIKLRVVQWRYSTFIWLTKYEARLSHILKINTNRKKPIPVAFDLLQVPEDLVKLHKDIYLMVYLFFVYSISFFLALSRKIFFTAFKHLSNRKSDTILKSFKEIYIFITWSVGSISQLSMQMDKFPHYRILSTSTYQEEPGSISQVQINTSHILNAKSNSWRR